MRRTRSLLLSTALLLGCGPRLPPPGPQPSGSRDLPGRPDESDAADAADKPDKAAQATLVRFFAEVESTLRRLSVASSEAEWEKSTNITDETERRAAQANEAVMEYASLAIAQARSFSPETMAAATPDQQRMFELLVRGSSLPAPRDALKREELAATVAKMEGLYGKGKYCPRAHPKSCKNLDQLSDVLAASRKERELRTSFEGWHAVGKELRPLFTRYVELANEGAREIGFRDLGELWRSRYDMPAEAFAVDLERLWGEVKPLYEALHCYARKKLVARYGKGKVSETGPIPAHLLGNMWAQDWSNLYPELEPYSGLGELDVTPALQRQGYTEVKMVELGEAFFTSLGLPALPDTFWERSMLKRPEGREVVCHASAWDVRFNGDLRIKMCIRPTQEDLITIHHELGHIYYFSQYPQLPILYQEGANDGFHEAIGDAIALSVTPDYLVKVGLLEKVPEGDHGALNQLMQRALDKIAFLPFGKVVDEWRWKVFSGEIAPDAYNRSWWELRAKVQGVAPPGKRDESDFDPGAKYHVAANVPYARYFLATVLQYQFHRALCRLAGHQGPLHTCSIYGNREVGERLRQMLALGASRPWPEALALLTGEQRLDATAIVDYFAPLSAWLAEQNRDQRCGY